MVLHKRMTFHFVSRLFCSVVSFSSLFRTRLQHFGFRKVRVHFGFGCSWVLVRGFEACRTSAFFNVCQVSHSTRPKPETSASFVALGQGAKDFVLSRCALGGIIRNTSNRRFGHVLQVSSRTLPALAVITRRSSGRAWRRAT